MWDASVLDQLCDPSLHSRTEAEKIAVQLMGEGPLFDLSLANFLVGAGADLPLRAIERGLGLLELISSGGRTLRPLFSLLKHNEPRIRSRVAVLFGKRVGNIQWAERIDAEPDARVRANIVEALWESTSDARSAIFLRALKDSDNRVVGNALWGLYLLEPAKAATRMIALADHPDPRFRRTAGWVMGKTRDGQFLNRLNALFRDPDKSVKGAALRALVDIRRASARAEEPVSHGVAAGGTGE